MTGKFRIIHRVFFSIVATELIFCLISIHHHETTMRELTVGEIKYGWFNHCSISIQSRCFA